MVDPNTSSHAFANLPLKKLFLIHPEPAVETGFLAENKGGGLRNLLRESTKTIGTGT